MFTKSQAGLVKSIGGVCEDEAVNTLGPDHQCEMPEGEFLYIFRNFLSVPTEGGKYFLMNCLLMKAFTFSMCLNQARSQS